MYSLRSLTGTDKPREGVIHANAVNPKVRETLQQVHPELPATTKPKLAEVVALPVSRTPPLRAARASHLAAQPAGPVRGEAD